MAGLYIHIPYCSQACYYCNFHFSTSLHTLPYMIRSLEYELALRNDYLANEPIRTIYFGGGTPSILAPSDLTKLFNAIKLHYPTNYAKEITLEANPEDVTEEKCIVWKDLGINRLSIGIQTFHEPFLRWMNRAHNAAQSKKAIETAQKFGFTDISADLIYGIPGSNLRLLSNDIVTLLTYKLPHISAYSLTIEENTVFGNYAKKGKLSGATDALVSEQFYFVSENLQLHGYEQYEISNFAQPNRYATHNTSYWFGEKYLGIGPGAHSYNGHSRQYNISNNPLYIKSLQNKTLPCQTEHLTKQDMYHEYLITRLRTQWGIDLNELENKFPEYMHHFHEVSNGFINCDWLKRKENRMVLTARGKLCADKVTRELFVV